MPVPVNIEFFGNLNDLLREPQRHRAFEFESLKSRSVKDLVESLGVPHTEIGCIVADHLSVSFDHPIHGGEKLQIYPPDLTPDLPFVNNLQPVPLEEPRFILDVHLGKLATYLRLYGFDSLYRNDYDDPQLAQDSARQNRILLTCDVKLLMRKQVRHGCLIRARKPRHQLLEVIGRYDLRDKPTGVVRCIDCNGIIRAVEKARVASRLKPLTRKYYDEFYQCDKCNKVYWKGSHYDHMQSFRAGIDRQLGD